MNKRDVVEGDVDKPFMEDGAVKDVEEEGR